MYTTVRKAILREKGRMCKRHFPAIQQSKNATRRPNVHWVGVIGVHWAFVSLFTNLNCSQIRNDINVNVVWETQSLGRTQRPPRQLCGVAD